MSRIRSIKPEWTTDEKLGACSDSARVLSVALITLADDYGRGNGGLATITAATWAVDLGRDDGAHASEVFAKASRAIRELVEMGYMRLYEVRGQRYFAISNWKVHQKVDHPGKPIVPAPEDAETTPKQDHRETIAKVSRETTETLAPDQDQDLDQGPGGERSAGARPAATPARRKDLHDYQGAPAEAAQAALSAASVAAGGAPRTRGGFQTQQAWCQVACDAAELAEALGGLPVAEVLATSARGFVALRGPKARPEWWHERIGEYYAHGKAGAVAARKPGEMAPVGRDFVGTTDEELDEMFGPEVTA